MRIVEIFYSLQGEGFLAGVPSVFIRLAGCPLRCKWCDTQYAQDRTTGDEFSIDQIIKELGILHQKTTRTGMSGAQTQQPAATSEAKDKSKYHQVQAGETLYGISRQYGLTVEQLRSYNNISPNATIKPGQKLKLTRGGKQ